MLESWGGVEHPERSFRNIIFKNRSGDVLSAESKKPTAWTVAHAPGEPVYLTYELYSPFSVVDGGVEYYRPVVLPELFHLIGSTGFVAPDRLLQNGLHPNIELCWSGFREAGFDVASSFAADATTTRTRIDIEKFHHSLFIAQRTPIRRIDTKGGTVCIALPGGAWKFKEDDFIQMTGAIIDSQRAFFDDFHYPHFLVSALRIADANPNRTSLGGTGLTNAFALFMTPNAPLADRAANFDIRFLLAHELFHNWNGRVIEREEPEQLFYWFSEGVTDFYTRRLLFRAGLIDADEYIKNLNRSLLNYAQSPVRNEPATRILADFWKNRDVERLPYLRGDVLALLLDYEIRKASNGTRSLDNLVREMVNESNITKKRWSTDSVIAVARKYVSDDICKQIRAAAVDGADVTIPADVLEPACSLITKRIGRFDPGIDLDKTRDSGVVSGLRAASNAAKAGLREGEKYLTFYYSSADPERPIVFTFPSRDPKSSNGSEIGIEYLPQGSPVDVPCIVKKPGAAAAAMKLF